VKTVLATRYADSRAADLSLTYGLRPLPALGTHRVSLPGIELELRILGASHQVVLGTDWSETVACLSAVTGTLPEHEQTVGGGFVARFQARCHRLDPDRFAAQVADIVRDCETDEQALVGEFPGSPTAVTALRVRAQPGGVVRWWTWHAYPQAGELVETVSVVRPR
jgi:Protein of unknown function DUF2617.